MQRPSGVGVTRPITFQPFNALDACSGQAFHLSPFTFHNLPPHLRSSAACRAVMSAIVLGTWDEGGRLGADGLFRLPLASLPLCVRFHSRQFVSIRGYFLRS